MGSTSIRGALLACVLTFGAWTAHAATIDVTTRLDVVADDGSCSLREAVSAANRNVRSGSKPGECIGGARRTVDLIRVPAGRYLLSLGGPGEDGNAEGDLDVTESVVVEGAGRGLTSIRNGIGDPSVRGDGDRLFHVASETGRIDLTVRALTVIGGDVGCSGAECSTGGSAIDLSGAGSLTIERCRVLRNDSSCTGESCGQHAGAPVRLTGAGALTIRGSAIRRNTSRCEGAGCYAGSAAIQMVEGESGAGDFILEDSVIQGNLGTCEGEECSVEAVVGAEGNDAFVRRTRLVQNSTACSGLHCGVGEIAFFTPNGGATIEATTLRENRVSCQAAECATGAMLYVRAGSDLEIRDLTAMGNSGGCEGADCRLSEHIGLQAEGDVIVDDFVVKGSEWTCTGVGCDLDTLLHLIGVGAVALSDVQVAESRNECTGAGCDADEVVRIAAGDLTIERSQVLGNQLFCSGDGCATRVLVDLIAEPGAIALRDTSISLNGGSCAGEDCTVAGVVAIESAEGQVILERTELASNSSVCGFVRCSAGDVLEVFGHLGLDVDTLTLKENLTLCSGAGCFAHRIALLSGSLGGVAVDRLQLESNATLCQGAECRGSEAMMMNFTEIASLANSSLIGNRAQCSGTGCSAGSGGALRNAARRLTITDSSFRNNQSDAFGAAAFNESFAELVLNRVVVRENVAGARGTVAGGGFGGGIFNEAANGQLGILRITNSDIGANQASGGGGGILNQGAIASISSTQITGNLPNDCLNAGGTGCP